MVIRPGKGKGSEFVRNVHQAKQLARGDLTPAFAQPLRHMVPVRVAKVQPDADPFIAEIGGAVIAGRIGFDQAGLFFGRGWF
jgi:hypothetical protein